MEETTPFWKKCPCVQVLQKWGRWFVLYVLWTITFAAGVYLVLYIFHSKSWKNLYSGNFAKQTHPIQWVFFVVMVGFFALFLLNKKLRNNIHSNLRQWIAIGVAIIVTALGIPGILTNTPFLLSSILAVLLIFIFEVKDDRIIQEEYLAEVRLITSGASTIKSFPSWDHRKLIDIISTAKKSIQVIDSNSSEHHFWATRAREAFEHGAESLDVSFYMLDHREIFGAQRLVEMTSSGKRKENAPPEHSMNGSDTNNKFYKSITDYQKEFERNCRDLHKSLGKVLSKDDERKFRKTSENDAKDSKDSEKEKDLKCADKSRIKRGKLKLYSYPTMPCLRAIVVDESRYIFGWFPLNALNPTHSCLYLDDTTILTESDRAMIKCIKHHIKEIECEATEWDVDMDGKVQRKKSGDETNTPAEKDNRPSDNLAP